MEMRMHALSLVRLIIIMSRFLVFQKRNVLGLSWMRPEGKRILHQFLNHCIVSGSIWKFLVSEWPLTVLSFWVAFSPWTHKSSRVLRPPNLLLIPNSQDTHSRWRIVPVLWLVTVQQPAGATQGYRKLASFENNDHSSSWKFHTRTNLGLV